MIRTIQSKDIFQYISQRLWFIIESKTMDIDTTKFMETLYNGLSQESTSSDRNYDLKDIVSIRLGTSSKTLNFEILTQTDEALGRHSVPIKTLNGDIWKEVKNNKKKDNKVNKPKSIASDMLEQLSRDYRQEKIYEISKKSADLSEKSIKVSKESLWKSQIGIKVGVISIVLALFLFLGTTTNYY